ncbi:MAG: YDG domain-containing protein, partial [Chakrabartia godavariana]
MLLSRRLRVALMGAVSMSAMSAAHAGDFTVSSGTITGVVPVTNGTATTTTVTQTSARAIINCSDLSVATGDTLKFVQPDASAVVLNRIVGPAGGPIAPSRIDGTLVANGQVWILNPSGVLVGGAGQVNVAGFVASTLAMTDAEFNGGTSFTLSGTSPEAIVNQGTINVGSGYAVLAGERVENTGLVQAQLGTVAFGSGQNISLSFSNDKLISFSVSQPATSTGRGVFNSGQILADGGRILMTARTAADAAASVINSMGLVQAHSVALVNGEIILDAGDTGYADVLGTLDVTGTAAGETGGTITVSGLRAHAGPSARLLAGGNAGGGNIQFGLGPSISGPSRATVADINTGAILNANAFQVGNGGQITVRTDYTNSGSFLFANGTFRADGGATGGAGGFIEAYFSSIDLTGAADTLAPGAGEAAQLSFNALNIDLADTPPATGAVGRLLTIDIGRMLDAGRRVSLNAIGDGPGLGDIRIAAPLSKSSMAASALSFSAKNSIIQLIGSDITSAAGSLDLLFQSDSDANSTGVIRLGGNIALASNVSFSDGLIGIKYEGYYDDNYQFFQNALVQPDPLFASPFTAINGTTPGQNFDDTYSVKFFGYFRPSVTGLYTFATSSDDASQLFLGSAGQSVNLLQSQVISPTPLNPLVNNAGQHGVELRAGTTSDVLIAGKYYPLLVLFGENGGGDFIQVDYGLDGQPLGNDGLGAYFHTPNGELAAKSKITFSGPVVLGADVNISTNGRVVFDGSVNSSVNGTYRLNVDAGADDLSFNRDIGATAALGGLTAKSATFNASAIATTGTGLVKIDVAQSGAISGEVRGGQLIKTGGGDLSFSGIARVSEIAIERGRFRSLSPAFNALLDAGTVGVGVDGILDLTAPQGANTTLVQSLKGSGRIELGVGRTLHVVNGRTADEFSGIVSGPVSSILRITGGALTLSGDVGFLGQIRVDGASLKLVGNGSIAAADRLFVEGRDGAVIDVSGVTTGSTTVRNFFTDTAFRAGSVILGGTTLVIDTALGNTGVNALSFSGGGGSISKIGQGTLRLRGANSFTGDTQVSAGVLDVTSEAQLGAGNITLGGGILRFVSGDTIALTKAITLVGDAGIEFQSPATQAVPFQITWNGAQFQNTASAVGFIDINTSVLDSAGALQSTYQSSDSLTIHSVTVQGATSGNGTFGPADFANFYYFGAANPLDYTKELIGQPMSNGFNFGSFTDGYGGPSGDFNVFAANPNAPNGTFYFQLTTSGGDNMALVSMAPLPAQQLAPPVNINVTSAVNGAFGLKIFANGNLSLLGGIGNSQPLSKFAASATGSLRIGADAQIKTTGNISLHTVSRLVNESVSPTVLSSENGTWRIYSGNQSPFDGASADVVGNINYEFKAYGVAPDVLKGNLNTFLAPGQNGLVYGYAPTISIASESPISKLYDGTTTLTGSLPRLLISSSVSGDVVSVQGSPTGQYAAANASATTFLLSGVNVSAVDAAGKPVYGYNVADGTSLSATIAPRPIVVTLTGSTTKVYDGTTSASLSTDNISVSGVVTGESVTVTRTVGDYASKDAGQNITVTSSLSLQDFSVGQGTSLSNYVLPTTASGAIGEITPKQLAATLTGQVSRIYDGTTNATLSASNFALSGLVQGESLSVTQTQGSYATKDVGTGLSVGATLTAADFVATSGTLVSNYMLPTTATGAIGDITPKAITVTLAGSATRAYDGTTAARLTSSNYSISGLVSGESLTIVQNAGTYAS